MHPRWVDRLRDGVENAPAHYYSRFSPPPGAAQRMSAVLALFADPADTADTKDGADSADGPDLLFIERASTLRSHAGQPAFPGGKMDPEDATPVDAALREAREEVGVDPATVEVFASLPPLFLPPSGLTVVTVLGRWTEPHDVGPVDPAEVAAVVRVPVRDLADPANRCTVRILPGITGPGFRAGGLLIWGFTAGIVDKLLALGGWERPWGPEPYVARPPAPTEEPHAADIEEAVRGS